jgi:hypothetical protein
VAARRALGLPCLPAQALAVAERRSSELGLAYLRCAQRGELLDAGSLLVHAILRGDAPDALAAVPLLRGSGASSGTALAWGIVAALARP